MNAFGNYLRELRGQRSLREIEKLTGLSHTYLSSLEKGIDPRSGKERKPTPDAIEKIAIAFGVRYLELMHIAGYLNEEDITITPNEEIMMEFVFFLQNKENLEELNKIGAETDGVDDKERLTRRVERQRNKILTYLLDEINLEEIFETAQKIKVGEKILSDQQKEQALRILKATFSEN